MPAVGLLLVAWAMDGLDGWLARRLDAQSETGRILDPLADKIVVCATAAALWAGGRIPGWLVAVIVARDVAIVGFGIPMWRRLGRVPRANALGKAAMFVFMATLAAALLDATRETEVLVWVALGAVVASGIGYGVRFLRAVRLEEEEGAPIAQSG